jgi:hypothetical protein
LIDFLKKGTDRAANPVPLYKRLAYLYELSGDIEKAEQCRRRAEEYTEPPDKPNDPTEPS